VVARLSTDVLSINDPAIAAALRLIREHAHERIQIDAIAHQVGLSRSVLQRNFRALLNRSVHDEILATRIRRARELLAGTDLPLAVVAQRAGFTHQEYMGAVFKAHVGKTPARIRKEDR
jgi:LacI family transcriptional regulator